MNKSKFLTFLLSFCPGLGHMYLGYMRRGTSFMLMFFGVFFIISLLSGVLGALGWLAPIIWCYSLFDALNLRNAMEMGRCALADEWLFVSPQARNSGNGIKEFVERKHVVIGVAVIAVGVLSIYQMVLRPWLYDFVRYDAIWGEVFKPLVYNLSGIIVSILLIVLGLWLAFSKKKPAQQDDEQTYIE